MPGPPKRIKKKSDRNSIGSAESFKRRSDEGESKKFYQTRRWRNYRNKKFKKDAARDKKRAHIYYKLMPKCTFQGYQKFIVSNAPMCVHCLDWGKLTPANTLDHISRIRTGAQKLDDMNLQWLCSHHHNVKSGKEKMTEQTTVRIVSGPPGSGKSTYVKENMSYGDIVMDFDKIIAAISFQSTYEKPKKLMDAAYRVRDLIYRMIAEPNKIDSAWIITTYSFAIDREQLANMFSGKLIRINTPADECKSRIKKQNRAGGVDWERLVDKYFKTFEPVADEITNNT